MADNWNKKLYNQAYHEIAKKKKWQNRDFDDQFDYEVDMLYAKLLKKDSKKQVSEKRVIKMFKDYLLAEAAREYAYKIKLAVDDFSDEQKDAMETALAKFDLRSVGSFNNTPIQQHPVDFPNVRNSRVFIAEFVLGYPVTVDELRVYLSDKIGVNQQSIAVYNAYDPRDKNNEEAIAIRDGIDEDEYETALGNDYPVEEKPLYGKDYNDKFLKDLEDQRKERDIVEVENQLSIQKKEDKSSWAADDVGEQGGWSTLGGPNAPLKK